jgi:hypothetical protein
MFGTYDRDLMRRGAAARECILDGEDPHRMLLQVVWPDHDWSESARRAELTTCRACSGLRRPCQECGGTGLVTLERRRLLAVEALARYVYDAA